MSPVVIIKAIIIIDVFVRLIELANFTIRRIKGDPRQRSRSKVTIENWSKTSTILKTLSTYLSQWWIVKLRPYTITTHQRQCWHHTWPHHSRSHTSSLPCFPESAAMTTHRVVSPRTRSSEPLPKHSCSLDAKVAISLWWMRQYRTTALLLHSDTTQGNLTSSNTRPSCILLFSSSNSSWNSNQYTPLSIGTIHSTLRKIRITLVLSSGRAATAR